MGKLTRQELCLLSLSDLREVGPASVRLLQRAAGTRGESLGDWIGRPSSELVAVGLQSRAAEAIAALDDPFARGAHVLEAAGQLGLRVAFSGTRQYPGRLTAALGIDAPPVLFYDGEPAMLDRFCVAIVGSRRPTRWAREAARGMATALARDGATIVSGAARGIDTEAHRAALEHGATAFIPPMGLARFRWTGRRRAPGDAWLTVGQFPLREGWRTPYALMRNRSIVALSEAVVAFEPRDTGGTWHSATQALLMGRPLFVVSTSRAGAKERGLKRLVRRGAIALDATRMPDASTFRAMAENYVAPCPGRQQGLFGRGEG